MKNGIRIIITAACLALLSTWPAHALDYDCSPFTGACVPRGSIDPPATVYVPPQRAWPRSCPLDGPKCMGVPSR
jgi:hypothetical protein